MICFVVCLREKPAIGCFEVEDFNAILFFDARVDEVPFELGWDLATVLDRCKRVNWALSCFDNYVNILDKLVPGKPGLLGVWVVDLVVVDVPVPC